jgi:hypothetical protein
MWQHLRLKHPDVLVEMVDEPGSLGRIGGSQFSACNHDSLKRDSAGEPKHSRRGDYRELGL